MLTITKTSQMSPFHDCNMASGLHCVMLFCWLFSYVLKIIDQQFHPYHQASLPWCHVTLDISARITLVITLMFTHWSNRNYARNYVMVVSAFLQPWPRVDWRMWMVGPKLARPCCLYTGSIKAVQHQEQSLPPARFQLNDCWFLVSIIWNSMNEYVGKTSKSQQYCYNTVNITMDNQIVH